jgi:hypothetical protein
MKKKSISSTKASCPKRSGSKKSLKNTGILDGYELGISDKIKSGTEEHLIAQLVYLRLKRQRSIGRIDSVNPLRTWGQEIDKLLRRYDYSIRRSKTKGKKKPEEELLKEAPIPKPQISISPIPNTWIVETDAVTDYIVHKHEDNKYYIIGEIGHGNILETSKGIYPIWMEKLNVDSWGNRLSEARGLEKYTPYGTRYRMELPPLQEGVLWEISEKDPLG